MKIDHRKHYVLVVDTETANTIEETDGKLDMSNVLVYDIGWAVVDTKGSVYQTRSYVNKDIYLYERELMQTAYYANKIPRYASDIREGKRVLASLYEIRQAMLATIKDYNIKEVVAHNARFDYNALNYTERWCTKSKYRYWFPFGNIEMWDTLRMAQDVICKMPTYIKFCEQNNYLQKNGKPRCTAEILYRFISKNNEFVESHTGLEDVLIETQIMWYCFKQHRPMEKRLFPNKKEFPPATNFQRALLSSIKHSPIVRMGSVMV